MKNPKTLGIIQIICGIVIVLIQLIIGETGIIQLAAVVAGILFICLGVYRFAKSA